MVCTTRNTPDNTLEREDGWRGFRIQGILDFSLIGVLSKISSILTEGAYSRINDISSYVHKIIKGKGYEICNAPLRKYFVSPNDEYDSNEYITEYYYPLKKI